MKTARWKHAAAIAGSLAVATAVADGSVFGPNLSPQNQRNTVLGYQNGPGYRSGPRVDPRVDPFPGRSGQVPSGPWHQAYLPEAAVPLGSDTHFGR